MASLCRLDVLVVGGSGGTRSRRQVAVSIPSLNFPYGGFLDRPVVGNWAFFVP